MDSDKSEDTRLLYCTTGVLLQKLINDKNMHRFTHVILDEVFLFSALTLGWPTGGSCSEIETDRETARERDRDKDRQRQ